jgi:hypothetical protein
LLEIGPAAEMWLIKAAAAGAQRVRRKTIEAVDLARLHGAEQSQPGARSVRAREPVR